MGIRFEVSGFEFRASGFGSALYPLVGPDLAMRADVLHFTKSKITHPFFIYYILFTKSTNFTHPCFYYYIRFTKSCNTFVEEREARGAPGSVSVSACLCLSLSFCLSVCLSLSLFLSLSLSLSVCLSVCLSLSLSLSHPLVGLDLAVRADVLHHLRRVLDAQYRLQKGNSLKDFIFVY